MATSKVEICNLGLALLGADAIRSFDEVNKRARMCDLFYESTRQYLLAKLDWPFARGYAKLKQINDEGIEIPSGKYGFTLPIDCATPRYIEPRSSRIPWSVFGKLLLVAREEVSLFYTRDEMNPSTFSATFINVLALGIAVRLCVPITQDKTLANALYGQFKAETIDSFESDANIGTDYKCADDIPDNDTFVNPSGLQVDDYGQDT